MEALDDGQVARLVRGISSYVSTGEVPTLDQVTSMAFSFIKIDLDKDSDKYEHVCERNRDNIGKRWNGHDAKDTSRTSGIPAVPVDTKNTKNTDSDLNTSLNKNINISVKTNTKENIKEKLKEKPKEKSEAEQVFPKNRMGTKEESCAKEERAQENTWDGLMERWINYRKKIGKSYKSQESIELAMKRLKELGNYDIEQATRIVDQSIANGWQGIFANKYDMPDKVPRSGQPNKFFNDSVKIYDNRL